MTEEKRKPLALSVIKSDKGCFVKRTSGPTFTITTLLINAEHPEETHDHYWFFVKKWPEEITRQPPAERTNYMMCLKAELLEESGFSGSTLGKMRPEIPRDECMAYDDCEWIWKSEFIHLSSLYELKYDEILPDPEVLEFECELYCEVPDLSKYSGMSYGTVGNWNADYGKFKITDRHIRRRAIDKIIYPSVMLPSCTAILSSELFYKLIRFHIKQNVDYRYAKITSDYDFCFTVEKRIIECKDYKLDQPKPSNQRNVRNMARSSCVIFEMTHAGSKYKSYTVLPKIQAKNNTALKRKIDKYLRELMAYINEPITVCEHCDGSGVVSPITKFNHPSDGENR